MSSAEAVLSEVLGAFDFGAPVVGAMRYGCGHINDTFCVHTQPEDTCCASFILQRMSPAAFKRPDLLMQNIISVTEYLEKTIVQLGGDPTRETLKVIRPRSGADYYTDHEGGAWRAFPFIKDIRCYQSADTPELFEAAGRAFGSFQRMLANYPAPTLHETIPRFHDTEDRLSKLFAAVEADPMDRVKTCQPEIDFVMARRADCSVALQALRNGILPLRVTHNDTKLNNILFDAKTNQGLCIIDLDTVMPGLSINDFGDAIRFGANHCAEDETNLNKVNFDIDLYEVYVRGFLAGTQGCLTPAELEYMP